MYEGQIDLVPQMTVPIFVPTPRIETLRTIARASSPERRKSLITGNIEESLATVVTACKL